ncbi:MAG TPA: GNAT family N-acetyltransferase [Rhizomicrobium sp.]|nr:GNAT family N-acetyltransferase [Rhizomicrobium sp.]
MSANEAHVLDHPIWSALTTRQEPLAQSNPRARRYPVDVAPFADMTDMSPGSFAALRELMQPGEVAVLFTPEPVTISAAFEVVLAKTGEQMIGTPADVTDRAADIVTLNAPDVPAMAELVALTNPGPFATRTHTLGTFLGIKIGDRLAAMIGERMKPGNYTEMTGICVHPDFRGRGYAQVLMAKIAKQIVARGEIPFLHVYSDNAPAIGLYRRQGMSIRRTMHVTVMMLQSDGAHE